ncbi:NADH dehydrogenase [ubiquinone] 1 beta subcomplex subunit 4 isoform X1 [Nasonia vitripennis]|uniref:NADH dehydrogenase [ubiquinone] 1 beta subcomplex subunit 4 n=1 Tax=Nasonia vitripennis TaxID=7425 RepID=A0A7M6UDG5_NASVI|nr:NADH dehydrogenase [ubiquinone] 1 beta subcomplex subunit 4 [Nasonia vitripennis]XP_032451649.1 NADH dehydrogenase [ubiquinone] 1 beta subcomplex subunit 4 isoform X1 [Nasonia vitripennis]
MSNKITGADEIYDVSAREREVIEWKAKRRLELRNLYLREKHNPNSPHVGHIFDPAVQRHYSTLFCKEQFFRPTVKSFLWNVVVLGGSMFLLGWRVKKFRDEKEHRFATGQVSYRDREWKFV